MKKTIECLCLFSKKFETVILKLLFFPHEIRADKKNQVIGGT